MNAVQINHSANGVLVYDGWNGQTGINTKRYVNHPVRYPVDPLQTPSQSSDTTLATKAMARTNPGRAHVQVPVFIAELRDLPKLIQIAGRTILGTAGKGYLNWQFGWKPLISDLRQLADFSSAVEKRKDELRRLSANGGIRRKYAEVPGGYSAQKVITIMLESAVSPVYGTRTSTSTMKRWAVLKWKPSLPAALLKNEKDFSALVAKKVLGLTGSQMTSNAWEAIPFSWLADWFTDMGDFLVASDNSVAHVSSNQCCVMQHFRSETKYQVTSHPPWVTTSGSTTALGELKQRSLAGISPFKTSLPFLNDGQLAIMAAFGAVASDRYHNYRR